ncbi:MAG: hypothetical protein OCD01_00595 [Fibrobacterales bacterium]
MIVKLLFWVLSALTTISIVGVGYYIVTGLMENVSYVSESFFGAGLIMMYSSPIWVLYVIGFFIFTTLSRLSQIEILMFKVLMICLIITVTIAIPGVSGAL